MAGDERRTGADLEGDPELAALLAQWPSVGADGPKTANSARASGASVGEREGARDPLARLLDRPGAFSFVAAASLLRGRGAEVRYRHDASLTHGGGELRAVREVAAAGEGPGERARPRYEVTASFLGAVGHAGPAPLYLAELAAAEDEAGELRRELLDVFHHRLYEILFTGLLGQDSLTEEILLAIGAGTLPLRRLAAGRLLALAPLLVGRQRSARAIALGLRHLLADDLEAAGGATLELEEFAGEWVALGPGSQMRLGDRASAALGHSTVIGAWCRDPASRVRVRVGPVPAAALADLSPGGAAYERLVEALRVLVADPIELELEVTVAGSPSPPLGSMRLGVDFRAAAPGAGRRSLRFPLPLASAGGTAGAYEPDLSTRSTS